MMDETRKYTYLVPGLERYRMETKKDVGAMIEELAFLNRGFIDEGNIKRLYQDHKADAVTDPYFYELLYELKSLDLRKSNTRHYAICRKKFLNYSIRNMYYAYVFHDFPEYSLTLEYIMDFLTLHFEYVEICSRIVDLYDPLDFEHIIMPKVQSEMEFTDRKSTLSKQLSEKGRLPVRQQYEIIVKIEEAKKQLTKELNYPKLKPVHYMINALSSTYKISGYSIHALRELVKYHLQDQDRAKKRHNVLYLKLAKRKALTKTESNSEKILEWIKGHPENDRKEDCANDLGIHRSTVYRNWNKVQKMCRITELK